MDAEDGPIILVVHVPRPLPEGVRARILVVVPVPCDGRRTGQFDIVDGDLLAPNVDAIAVLVDHLYPAVADLGSPDFMELRRVHVGADAVSEVEIVGVGDDGSHIGGHESDVQVMGPIQTDVASTEVRRRDRGRSGRQWGGGGSGLVGGGRPRAKSR